MGWLIAAAIICGLAFLPIGFRAVYRQDAPGVWLLIGPFKLRVYPKTKSKEKPPATKTKSSPKPSQKGGSYKDFQPVISTVTEFLGEFRRKIRVNHLELKMILAGDDPADLAVNYGRAWIALGNLMPQLERLFIIKKRNLEVECDFTATETRIFARLDATITLARTVHLLTRHGAKVLKELLKLRKLQKGGAKL